MVLNHVQARNRTAIFATTTQRTNHYTTQTDSGGASSTYKPWCLPLVALFPPPSRRLRAARASARPAVTSAGGVPLREFGFPRCSAGGGQRGNAKRCARAASGRFCSVPLGVFCRWRARGSAVSYFVGLWRDAAQSAKKKRQRRETAGWEGEERDTFLFSLSLSLLLLLSFPHPFPSTACAERTAPARYCSQSGPVLVACRSKTARRRGSAKKPSRASSPCVCGQACGTVVSHVSRHTCRFPFPHTRAKEGGGRGEHERERASQAKCKRCIFPTLLTITQRSFLHLSTPRDPRPLRARHSRALPAACRAFQPLSPHRRGKKSRDVAAAKGRFVVDATCAI